jgi:DUF4097 and DUF4098 domain-containing protein YvlB
MPTFDTPEPITATIELALGDVQISAGDSADTVVDVQPNDASDAEDRKAAELTRVEYANGRLLVRSPKARSWIPRRSGGSISVTIALPAGSHLRASAGVADFRGGGPLGDCVIETGVGRIQLDEARTLTIKSGTGDVSVGYVSGHAEISMASGDVRIRELGSGAVIKESNGDTWVGVAGGDLEVGKANGSIAVDQANGAVDAKTARGDLRIGEVARGSVVLETYLGDVEVGIREGTAAWLDVRATAGSVNNELDAADAPESSAETVEVRARTTVGDVVVRRAQTNVVSA